MKPDRSTSTPPQSGHRRTAAIAAAGATADTLIAAAAWATGSRLPSPEAGRGGATSAWLWASPEAAFAHGARLVVLVLATYLATTQFLVSVSAVVGSVRAQQCFDRLSLGLVGRICAATTTSVGTLAALSTPALARSEVVDRPAPLLRLLEDPAPAVGDGPVLQLLTPDGPEPMTAPPFPSTSISGTPMPMPTAEPPAAQTPSTWVVHPGESFWSIAEEHLGRDNTTSDTQAVSRYWLRLIEANRDRLADPSDPDLLFSGQVLDLPPH